MAGLLSQQMQPQAGAAQAAAQSQAPNQAQDGDQGYKQFTANVLNTIYNQRTLPTILQRFKTSDDPVEALAQVTAQIVARVQQSANQNGIKPSAETVLRAGAEAITDLANLSAEGGAHKFSDQEIQAAFIRGVDFFRTLTQSPATQAAAQQDLAQMKQAEQSGQIDKLLPGLTSAVSKLKSEAPANAQGGETQAEQEGAGPAGSEEMGAKPEMGVPKKAVPPPAAAKPQGQFKRKGMRQSAKRGRR